MATYDYRCSGCDDITEQRHGMNEEPELSCKLCGERLHKTFITAPACNLGWDNQAAGNANKYWGTTPLVDISCPPGDGKPGFHIEGKRDKEF